MQKTIGHILAADETWFLRMQEKANDIQIITAKSIRNIEDIERESFVLYSDLRNYLLHKNIESQIDYKNTKGEQFRNSISEMIQHMVNHGTYHRGNVAAMIRQMGYERVATDYLKYVRTS
ncbi:DinB family protein [Ureibacillus sp. GCM10028918]|uniref:DinB family protein n=1 Tax=Ureibacillus sp. GCM10028918 TaxID=3273429 RepID=UPI003621474F